MSKISALLLIGVVLLVLSGCQPVLVVPEEAAPTQAVEGVEPIRVGSTLPLTGFLAPIGGTIHPIIGDIFLAQVNELDGLLGRPVEWVVFDDESSPEKAAALYERLITEEKVDLIIGPHGSHSIAAAMDVAERHSMVFPHHTGSLAYAYTYRWHFPAGGEGRYPNHVLANLVFDGLESTGTPPKTVAFVINQFPGTMYTSRGHEGEGGAVEVAKDRGYDVVLDLEYPAGTTDFSTIAAKVRDADPDFVYLAGVGMDANNLIMAMQELDYQPRGMFAQWPASGPLAAVGENVLSRTSFEPYEPYLSFSNAAALNEAYSVAASEAGLAYPVLESIAAQSWTAWQVLTAGVEGAGSLDQSEIAEWLLNNEVETIIGQLDFDPDNENFYPDKQTLRQVRDGKWVVVFPPDFATEGYELQYSPQ